MNKEIKKLVLSCDLCQRVKSPNIKRECPYNLVRSREPDDLVTVDFHGPLPRSCGGWSTSLLFWMPFQYM